jgi:hypothetical protein
MALAQSLSTASTSTLVDSRPMTCGWHDAHNAAHEATPWDSFAGLGTASVRSVAVATASTAPIPFVVLRRDDIGGIVAVQSGTFPAGTLQADAATLGLDVSSFTVASLTHVYAVIPAGTIAPSTTVPNGFVWAEAPADGGGFVVTLVVDLV